MYLPEQSATGRTVVLLIDYDNLQICASRAKEPTYYADCKTIEASCVCGDSPDP